MAGVREGRPATICPRSRGRNAGWRPPGNIHALPVLVLAQAPPLSGAHARPTTATTGALLTNGSLYGNLALVNVIAWRSLQQFAERHRDALPALQRWYDAARRATWRNLIDVRKEFPAADAVGPLTIFNIRGNRYRLITRIDYRWQVIFIKAVHTHAEYDRGDWKQ